ncbi:MAG TPA: response regulator transcription factor [Pyrinomonadaceae bacterium]|nr:response regulator transcription factor [Pyrinomonadaceae bacterium]
MKKARIILADDHTLMLDALENLLATEYEVVGVFHDGRSLVENAVTLDPNVVVLDIGMPTMNGLLAGELLKKAMPAVKLVYMTMNRHSDLAAEAFQLGASAYLLKTSAGSELLHALSEVLSGRTYVTPLLKTEMEEPSVQSLKSQKRRSRLTARQQQILQLLAEGLTMKEIGFKLDLSTRTIAFHKYSIMAQLEIKNTAELVVYATRHAMVCAS